MNKKLLFGIIVMIMLLIFAGCATPGGNKTSGGGGSGKIRLNSVGYLSSDQKLAIIGTNTNLQDMTFDIVNAGDTEQIIYTGYIGTTRGNEDTPFTYNLSCDFSDLTEDGTYKVRLYDGTLSHSFTIGAYTEYREALAIVLRFYRSQRCGDNDPVLHNPCHLNDANAEIDASGGWHDAGDYIKFLNTISFVTLNLLTAADYGLSYGMDDAFADSSPANGTPDLIEEGRIGLDWMLKMTTGYAQGDYYYQVSGAEDHNYWRMPERDDSTGVVGNPRTLHKDWGGNLLGRTAASLAIAARVFQGYDADFADQCLARAEALFADRQNYQNVRHSNPEDYYYEPNWRDDLVVAAAELYQTTGKTEYHDYAATNLGSLNSDGIGWYSTDFLALAACYRADITAASALSRMSTVLADARSQSNSDVYCLSSGYTWGTTALFTADAQKAIMYYYLTDDDSYIPMAQAQRDYLLGRNNWGVSFVVGLGEVYPLNSHSQLNDLAGLHKGAVVGGPAVKGSWDYIFSGGITGEDRFEDFQSDVVYYDKQEDYYCNEVAIDYAACSVFIFLYNASQAYKASLN